MLPSPVQDLAGAVAAAQVAAAERRAVVQVENADLSDPAARDELRAQLAAQVRPLPPGE